VTYDELGIAASEIASATVLAPTEVDLQYKVALDGDGSEIEVEAIQDILGLLQVAQRRGAAHADLAAARARAVAATVELVANVERSYVDVVAAQQELELREAAFDAASASAEIAERMHAAGNLPELALARERDRREQTRIDVARAQLDIEVAREAMNEVLGLSGKDTTWSVTNRLPEIPEAEPALDAIERDAVAASLDLAAIRSEEEAAAGRLGIARVRSWIPELGVGVATSRKDGEWEAGPALSIGLPIFNQQQGPRARANAELRRARNEASAAATELRAQARATRQRLLAAHAEARHLRDVVMPLRQRIVDETLKQYNAMNASTFELLTARRDLVEGGRQYIDALRRFWRASADARALVRGAMPHGRSAERAPTASGMTTTEGH
jgi:cobalt-zinc-cadmium efflux system outer membrane protein